MRNYKYWLGGLTSYSHQTIIILSRYSAMVALMNEKSARKPRNILINPDALHKARVEALRERKTIGQWLEELIEEKLAKEEREKQ